jgi:undecaprenyl-diphosphatase
VDTTQAIVLGFVQGLTEFLPVSSTAHLRIVPSFLGWEDPGAARTAVIQLGTMAAILLLRRVEIARMLVAWARGLLELRHAPEGNEPGVGATIIATRVAFVVGLASIAGLLGLAATETIS